ncbi:group I truncated hemoglobin [Roseateles sp. GG27B]
MPLFERLGGNAGVSKVVGLSLNRAAQDPRTQRSFDGIKIEAVQKSLTQQICSLAGGGCVYEGETMARSHQDLKITASEFDTLVEMLRQELDRAGIAAGAKNELLRLLAPMKRDIVAAR